VIYIKEGEVLTQVMPTDAMAATERMEVLGDESKLMPKKRKRKSSKRSKAYGRHFKKLAPKYKLKSGKWKKDGFKRCVRAAHAAAKKEMK